MIVLATGVGGWALSVVLLVAIFAGAWQKYMQPDIDRRAIRKALEGRKR
jgi:hypothetical protein